MRAQSRFRSVLWILLAVFIAGSPTAALAQRETASEGQDPPAPDLPQAAQDQAAPSHTEDARSQTGTAETQEETEPAEAETEQGPQVISGMSILGNQEAPTSLVIVPWKSSQIGESVGISTMLDDSRQPVDREVFMRALRFYEIRSETNP